MLNTIRFMLLAVLTMVCGNLLAQDETTVTWEASSGDALTTIYPDGNISLKWEEGGGDFAPKYSGENVYFYNGNRLTVAGTANDVTITKIVFTFSSGSASLVTCDASGKNESTAGITNSSANMTSTWEGESNSLIFRAARQTGVRYISSIEVTYTGGTTGPVEKVPVLAITQDGIANTYDMDANGVFVVYYENQGTAAAENAKLTLSVDGQENASKTIGTLAIGKSDFWNAKYVVTNIEKGEHQVVLSMTADNAETVTVEKTVTFTKKDPEATFTVTAQNVNVAYNAQSYDVVATVKNTSTDIDATGVQVMLQRNIQNIVEPQTIDLAAGEEKTVTFTVTAPEGGFTAGSLDYWVMVKAYDKTMAQQEITITVEEAPVEETKDLAITDITGTIELANETSQVRIIVENKGNVDIADAVVTLKAGDKVLGTATVSANAGATGYCYVAVASEGLEAGELDVTATVEVADDANIDDNTKTATLTVKEIPAPEATFSVNVNTVNVLTTDETVKVVVTVENTSEVKADQVEVKILRGMEQLGESKWIYGLEGGASQNVTITFDNFDKAGTYELQAIVGKTGQFFNVVVSEPVLDLAIESIAGTIDLANTSNTVTVTVKNNGEADVKDAKITLTYNNETLENTVSAKVGEQGYAYFQVPSEGIEGETLAVTATVEVEGDNTPADNTKAAELTVKAAPQAEATFSVTAENVTVAFGAKSFEIVATVTNTSEVDAQGLTVKLLKGITAVDEQTLNVVLAAGTKTDVTFHINEVGEAGTTATYYVQCGTGQAEVVVTFAEEETTKTNDLAIESIAGTIDLSATQSTVTVTVTNNGEVDAKNVKATLTYGETTLEKTITSIKAGEQGYAYFQVPSEGIEGETLAVTAAIDFADDNAENNTLSAELTVKPVPAAEPTFTVTADDVTVTPGQDATATIKVTNTSEVDAQNVELKVLYSTMTITTKTIDEIKAGETEEVTFTVPAAQLNQILAMLGGKTSVELFVQVANKAQTSFTVTVKEEETPVVDMALTQIQGAEINLQEENKVMVWYQNNGNVATTATISATLNGTALEAQTVENVKAEGQGHVDFILPVEGLTAGEIATFVATITAENDNNAENNELTKELTIVSGEEAPAAVIALNPVASQEVEAAGEQTINVNVSVFNNGDADAENVEIKVYQEISTVLASKTVNVNKGESAIVTLSFDYDIQKATEFHVAAYYENKLADDVQDFTVSIAEQLADVTIAKISDVEATTEEEVTITATIQNKSDIAAEKVLVALYQGTEQVGTTKAVNELAAGAEATVEFALGQLEAGTYNYSVQIVSADANAENNAQSFTVKVTEPVEQKVEVSLTAIQGISNIDLAEGATNTITVWVENAGNVDADATVNVTLNGNAVGEAQTLSLKAGKNGGVQFTLPTEGLTAGEKATVVATVTVADNTSEATTLTREYDVVNSDVATEPVYEISAADVEVEFGAEKFDVVATVKNVSSVAAENVEVTLFYNGVIATQTIEALAADAETTVTFADVANPFTKAGDYTMYIQAPKAQAEVKITVKPEAVEEVVDLAITEVIGTIELANETSNVRVTVQNNGNVDITDATVTLKAGEKVLGTATVSAKAEETGFCMIAVASEGLEAGELAVTATVEVEGDATPEDNTLAATLTVKESPVAEPTFSITAENVTVPFGAESYDIVAVITNTSEVDAQGLTVKLLKGITVIMEETLDIELKAGESYTKTYTFYPSEEDFGTTATYYVQAGEGEGQAQAEVTVTFEEEPAAEVYDLAVTSISGELSLDLEKNHLYVYVENKGNMDATVYNSVLELYFQSKNSGSVMDSFPIALAAGESKLFTFDIDTEDLNAGEMKFVVQVDFLSNIEDANPEDNRLEKTYTIEAAKPELSFTVDATTTVDAESLDVKVTVTNSEKTDAENVVVTVYDNAGAKLGETTIAALAAGAEETVVITVDKTYSEAGTVKNELQVTVSGVEGSKWVNVTVTETTTAIQAVYAKYGKDAQIYSITGKKVNDVRRGYVYIINGKKVVIK